MNLHQRSARGRASGVAAKVMVLAAFAVGAVACSSDESADPGASDSTVASSDTTGNSAAPDVTNSVTTDDPASTEGPATTDGPTTTDEPFIALASALPVTLDMDAEGCVGNLPCILQLGAVASPLVRPTLPATDSPTIPGPNDVDPYLASEWERQPDGHVIFKLRDATSSYGNKLTAADVEWTYQRAFALSTFQAALATAGGIDTANPITVIDPMTVQLNVVPPGGPFTLAVASSGNFGIIDSVEAKKHVTDADPWAATWLNENLATFGAYQLEAFTPGESLSLTANPNYWDQPYFQNVRVQAVPDASVRLQLVMSGDATYTSGLTWSQFGTVTDTGAANGVEAFTTASAATDAFGLNQLYEPFAKTEVRQAINMAIDREAINTLAFGGFGKPALYPYPDSLTGGFLPDPVEYNPERAKELLAEAGYADGFEFTLSSSAGVTGDYVTDEMAVIQAQLAEVGITMNIDLVASPAELRERGGKLELQAHLQTVGAQVPAPLGYLNGNFNASQRTFSSIDSPNNPELYADMTKAVQTPPGAEGTALDTSVIQRFAEYVPVIQTVTVPRQVITRQGITGYTPTTIQYYDHLKVA